MDSITIKINGQIIDLWDAEKLNISAIYSITDINEIDSTKNSITREIKVPATNRNRIIFGFPEDISSASAITQKIEARGLIEAQGVEIMKGKVKMLKNVTNASTEYSFNIIGDNGDWRTYVDGVNLKSLNLTDQDHALTRDNVLAAEPLTSDKMYKYPLLNLGKMGAYNAYVWTNAGTKQIRLKKEQTQIPFAQSQSNKYPFENLIGKQITLSGFGLSDEIIATVTAQTNGTANILGTTVYLDANLTLSGVTVDITGTGTVSLLEGNHFVKVSDLLPTIQVKGLVDRIFQGSGYRIRSNWLNNVGRRLYMVKGTDNGRALDDETAATYDFNVGLTTNKIYNPEDAGCFIGRWEFPKYNILELDNIDTDLAFLYNTDEHYWSPSVEGRYKFTFKAIITATPVGRFRVVIIKLALDGYYNVLGARELENTTEPAIDFDFEVTTTMSDFASFIKPGERVYVLVGNVDGPAAMTNNQIIVKAAGCEFINEQYNPEIGYNSIISLNRFLPDNTGLELMQGLKQIANLYFLTDVERGIIYMEPRDDFYKDDVVNWSRKIDLSRDIEIEELGQELPKKNLYTYMQDAQDNRAQRIEDSTEKRIGSQYMELQNIFATDEDEENVNDIFAPTLMDKCIEGLGAIKFDTTEIPYLRNGQERYSFDTRLFYFEGVKALPPGESWALDGLTRTTYPKFFSIDKNNYNYNSLYFDDLEKCIGLARRNYGGLYEQLNNSSKLTAYFNLKPTDVEPFVNIDNNQIKDYRARFFLGDGKEGGYYRMDQIQDYRPNSSDTTKVSLVKDTDLGVLPIYPIFAPVIVEMWATDTVAGGTTEITIVIKNLGSEPGTVEGNLILPDNDTPIYVGFEIPGNGTFTFVSNEVVSADLVSGSYTVYLVPDPVTYNSTGIGLYAEADFYIAGCTTPAAFIQVGDIVFTPPLDQLTAGMNVAVSFTVKNTGCLTGSTSQVCTVDNRNFSGSGPYYSAYIQILNLPGGQSTTKTFVINNLQNANLRLDFLGSVIFETITEFIEASNPNSPPVIITKTPAHNATGIAIGTKIRAVWNENVTIQPGKSIKIYRYVNGNSGNVTLIQTVPSADLAVISSTTWEATINTLEANKTYCVVVDAGLVKNGAGVGNLLVPIDDWKFTTRNVLVMEIGDDFLGVNKGGSITRAGVSWAIANSSLTGVQDTSIYETYITVWNGNTKYTIRRFAIYFDTTNVLPVGATLDAAEITMFVNNYNENGAKVVKSTTTTLTATSFSEKETVLLSTIAPGVFGLQVAPVPASSINLTAKTGFVFMDPLDFNNTPPMEFSPGAPEWRLRASNFRLKLYYYI